MVEKFSLNLRKSPKDFCIIIYQTVYFSFFLGYLDHGTIKRAGITSKQKSIEFKMRLNTFVPIS